MHVRSLIAHMLIGIAMAAAGANSACSKAPAVNVEEFMSAVDAIVEEHDGGTAAWRVNSDGLARVMITGSDGKPLEEGVIGTLTWEAEGQQKRVPLASVGGGMLEAKGPLLQADLTTVRYDLMVRDKPWNGVLHLPRGGTAELGQATSSSDAGKVETGPHGGVVQLVGPDRIEVVADSDSGELRAYVLDDKGAEMDVGERQITIAVAGATPETVKLTTDASGKFATAKLRHRADPVKLTVVVKVPGAVRVVLVGWHPGVRIKVKPGHGTVHIWGPRPHWKGDKHPGHGGHHADHHHGHDVNVDIHVDLGGHKHKGPGKAKGHKKHH